MARTTVAPLAQIASMLFVPPTMETLDTTPAAACAFTEIAAARLSPEDARTLRQRDAVEAALRRALPEDLHRSWIRLLDALGAEATSERDTAFDLGVAVGRQLTNQGGR